MKIGNTGFIISVLNSFDKNIQFMFENNETIPFLDIFICRKKISHQQYIKNQCVIKYI